MNYYPDRGGNKMAAWLLPKFPRKQFASGTNHQGHGDDAQPIAQPRASMFRLTDKRPPGYDPYRGARSYDK